MERAPCPDCGELIVIGAKVCRFCGRGRDATANVQRSPSLAALMSLLLPGAGQLYAGHEWGCALFLLFLLLCYFFLPLAILVWMWAVFDAASRARKANGDRAHNSAHLAGAAIVSFVLLTLACIWWAHAQAPKPVDRIEIVNDDADSQESEGQ